MSDPLKQFNMDRVYFNSGVDPEQGYKILQKINVFIAQAREGKHDSVLFPKKGVKIAWLHPISQALYARGYKVYDKIDYFEVQWPMGLDGIPVPDFSLKTRMWKEVKMAGLNTFANIREYSPGRNTLIPLVAGSSLADVDTSGSNTSRLLRRPSSVIYQGPVITQTQPSIEEKLDKAFNFTKE